MSGGKGNDCLVVGDGNNVIADGTGSDVVIAGNGRNTITVTGSRNTVIIGNGDGNRVTVKGAKKGKKYTKPSSNRVTIGDGAKNRVTLRRGTKNQVTLGSGASNRVTVRGSKNQVTVGNGAKNRITVGKGTKNLVIVGKGKYNRVTTRAASKRSNTCSAAHSPTLLAGLTNGLLPRHHPPLQGGDEVIRRAFRNASAAVGMAGVLVLGLGAGSAFGYFTASGAGNGSASTATMMPVTGTRGNPHHVAGSRWDRRRRRDGHQPESVRGHRGQRHRKQQRDSRRWPPDLHAGLGYVHQPERAQRRDPRGYDAGAVVPRGGLDEPLCPERLPGRELLDPADADGAFIMIGRRPRRPGRGLRLLLAALGAVVGVLLTAATGAFGYWLATSTDNPSLASADSMPTGATPSAATTPSANSTTVAVTFAAASTSPGNVAIPAGKYTLRRYPPVGAPVLVTATCSGTSTITCTEANVSDGTWQYTNTPTYGLNWVGTESTRSAAVIVDTTPPVVAVPSVTAGYVTVLSVPVGVVAATDSGSGVNTSGVLRASATLSGGTCGTFGSFTPVSLTSGNDNTVLTNTCYQYQQQATDNVGNTTTSTTSNTVRVDNTAPTVPTPAVTAGYVTASTVPVGLGTVTDAGSGVNTSGVLRASATLSGGTCGSFGSFTAVSLSTGNDTTIVSGTCYQYQQRATDNAGNVGTSTTSNIVKVDTTAPPVPTLTYSALSNVSVTGTTAYYRSTASSGGFTVTASSTDSESGIANYTFPSLGTGWTFTGSGATRTYSWSGTNPTTSSGGLAVTATNNAGQTSSGSNLTNPITMVSDTTPPVVAVPSVTAGYVTVLSVPVGVVAATDSGSGVNTSGVLRASATLSGGTCGTFGSFTPVSLTSGNDNTVLTNTCYQYQQQATDNVGNTTTSTPSNTVKVDNTAPTVPTPAVTAGYVTASTVPVGLGTVTDAGSGVNTSGVLRASATLSGGTCGSFGSFTAVSLSTGNDTTIVSGTCYQYQQRATDNAGNVGTSTTSNIVKVDTTAPPVPTLTHSTLSNVSVTGTTAYYRSTASSGSFTVTASSTDSESGIANYTFPSLGTGWTFTGSGATRTYSWSGQTPPPPAAAWRSPRPTTPGRPPPAPTRPTRSRWSPTPLPGRCCAVGDRGLRHRALGPGRGGGRHRQRLRGQHQRCAARLRDTVGRDLWDVRLLHRGLPDLRERQHRPDEHLLPVPATGHRQRRQHHHLHTIQHRQSRQHRPTVTSVTLLVARRGRLSGATRSPSPSPSRCGPPASAPRGPPAPTATSAP